MSFPTGLVHISIGDDYLNVDSTSTNVVVGETPGVWEIVFHGDEPYDSSTNFSLSYIDSDITKKSSLCLTIVNHEEEDGSFNMIVQSDSEHPCQRYTMQEWISTPPMARMQSVHDNGYSATKQVSLNVAAATNNTSSADQMWEFTPAGAAK